MMITYHGRRIPPSVYVVNNVVIVPPIYEERYIVVENRYFLEPFIYKHHHKDKYWLGDWRRIDGLVVVNNRVIDRGPDVTMIRNITGKEVNSVSIERVKDMKKMNYSDKELSVYSPDFRKIKTDKKIKKPDIKPDKFVNFEEKKSNHKERSAGSNEQKGKNDNDSRKNNGSQNNEKGKDYKDNSKGKNKSGDDNNLKNDNKDRGKYHEKGNDQKRQNDQQKRE